MHPREPSPGVVVTLPLSQENQSTNGTPRRQHPRNQPAASQMWWKSSTSFASPTGGLSQIHLQNTLAYSRKQGSKRREAPGVLPGATCPGVWSPCGSPALIPCSRCRALGQPVLFLGTMAWGADPQDKWSRQLPGPSLPESSRLGWLHTSKQGSMSPPVC